jgi:hypothetical protein
MVAPGLRAGTSVTLSLLAQHEMKGWQKTTASALTIQCENGKAAVYVETRLPLEVTMVDKQIVRVRLDDSDFVSQRWRGVNDAVVLPRDAAAMIEQRARSQKFALDFTPFGNPPARAEVAVEGLADFLPLLEKAGGKK